MQKLKQIAELLQLRNITLYFVGGYCRDLIMGNTPDDIDICIVGGNTATNVADSLEMCKSARLIDTLTAVHGDFPIWIVEIDGEKYEFAMARSERKTGLTRTEFECMVQDVTIEEDLARRDLTINAIAKNVLTGEIVDPFDGQNDIELKVAHPVSEAFAEDTLRVYRAARFIARFNLTPSYRLIHVCKDLEPIDISNERVGMELMKMFKQAQTPSLFFKFLRSIRWLGYHFPELEDLIGVIQNTEHHPEGDAYEHTLYCMDAAKDWFIRAIMLCHDLGKATCTTINSEGKIQSIGHEQAGVELTRKLLKRIHFCDHKTINQIACLVELHMVRAMMKDGNKEKIARKTLRKLMHYELGYPDLVETVRCDLAGRPPKVFEGDPDIGQNMMFHLLLNDSMIPVVTGEKLTTYGLQPGAEFGVIMTKALELQDRGTLNEDNWIEKLRGSGFKQFKTKI